MSNAGVLLHRPLQNTSLPGLHLHKGTPRISVCSDGSLVLGAEHGSQLAVRVAYFCWIVEGTHQQLNVASKDKPHHVALGSARVADLDRGRKKSLLPSVTRS